MTSSTLYHTQGIRGYKYGKTQRKNDTEYYSVHSTASFLSCLCCGSTNTTIVKTGKTRDIRGLHVGLKKRFSEWESDVSFVLIVMFALRSPFLFVQAPT